MSDAIGAVTFPIGFKAAGVRAGLKEQGPDMALIVSDVPAAAAGVFTTNVMKAAPVLLSRSRVPSDKVSAVIVNSGNANACTGEQGMADALAMTEYSAQGLGVSAKDVLVASTGIIGKRMPMDKITAGIADAVRSLSADGGADAARAIMTTDTVPKEAVVEMVIGGAMVRIGGIAKGAGMICPNVATMLSFITTDAAITPETLQKCLAESAEVSFNCLTVDGDTSTNDSVIMLANGLAGNDLITTGGKDVAKFQEGLDSVTMSLARQIAADGEGATKNVTITVQGANTYDECRQIAKTVANSPLVKTALFGCDPNWGRVLAAAGRAGVDFDPAAVELCMGDIVLVQSGEPVAFSEDMAHDYLTNRDVLLRLKVGDGESSATVWTCDFSYDYVRVNAEYHT